TLDFDENRFLEGTADPRITYPTTVFTSKRRMGETQDEALVPATPHSALVWMLVLTQVAVGGFSALAAFGAALSGSERGTLLTLSLTSLIAGLLVSVFHLGRPHL